MSLMGREVSYILDVMSLWAFVSKWGRKGIIYIGGVDYENLLYKGS